VTPATRDATEAQNRAADAHRAPNGGASGPDTCAQGFVWRDAYEGDHACVTPADRAAAAADNRAGSSRRAGPT